MVVEEMGPVFSLYLYIMVYSLFRCIMYFSHIHSEAFSFVCGFFFLQEM